MVPSLGHCPKSRSGWRRSPSLIPGTRTSREAMAHKWRRPPGSGVRDGRGASRKRSENARNLVPKGAVRNGAVDFEAINAAALPHLPTLCARWLPDGRREGHEWSSRNPRRVDRRPGSFKVNLVTGQWADFALSDARGGDLVSLAAYLSGQSQTQAARALATMLGLEE